MSHKSRRHLLIFLGPLLVALIILAWLTVAGTQQPADIQATEATLTNPGSIALDRAGNVYFTEERAGLIRKVDASTGCISTVAGGGENGADGSLAIIAKLERPSGVAVDTDGNIYITEFLNAPIMGRIRRVDAVSGTISTIAAGAKFRQLTGPGLAMTTPIEAPWGLVVDAQGNLILLDPPHNILRINPRNGRMQLLAHHPTIEDKDLPPIEALVKLDSDVHPTGLALDQRGKLYFMGTDGGIRKIDVTTGTVTHIAGAEKTATNTLQGTNTLPALTANFPDIVGMSVDAQNNIYLSSSAARHIYKITAATGLASIIAGDEWAPADAVGPYDNLQISQFTGPATQVSLSSPCGIVADDRGRLYFADMLSGTVRKLDFNTNMISIFAGIAVREMKTQSEGGQ